MPRQAHRRLTRLAVWAVAPLVAGAPLAACDTVAELAFGGSAATLEGTATAGGACVGVMLSEGQRARVQVEEGEVVFAVDDLIEGQEDFAFVVPTSGRRTISVTPIEGAPEPFALTVFLEGRRAEEEGRWRLDEGEGRVTALAWIGEAGGPSVSASCAEDAGLSMTYDGVGTVALVEGPETAPGAVEITVGGEARLHPVTLTRFDGFDRYWEVSGPADAAALLADFAAGSRLRLLDEQGASAGAVGLAGSAAVRDAMARQCGL